MALAWARRGWPYEITDSVARAWPLVGRPGSWLGTSGGGGRHASVLSEGVIQDVIKDFTEITRAAFTEDETENEAETAFVEVAEYVRVSVHLVVEELHGLRAADNGIH